MRLHDLTGQRINHLTVIKRHGTSLPVKWECICDCGNTAIVSRSALKAGQLSCGCVTGTPFLFRHSHANKLYNKWQYMIYRCYYPSATDYEWYGGKGITVCDEWKNDFDNFALWSLTNGYADNLELDRIDSNSNYTPSNCRWITHKQNSRNRGIKKTNRTGCTGVVFRPSCTGIGGKWRAMINVDGKNISLGTYENFDQAVKARKEGEKKYFNL